MLLDYADRFYNPHTRLMTYLFDGQPRMDVYIRGGVCFPMIMSTGPVKEVQGFAMVCGQDINTGIIYVLDYAPYLVIETIFTPEGGIEYKGLSPWLVSMWAQFRCDTFYFNQDEEVSDPVRIEILRSKTIQPKPHFISVSWKDNVHASMQTWKLVQMGKLRFKKGSIIHTELNEVTKDHRVDLHPSIQALYCAINGMERYPYRVPALPERVKTYANIVLK